MAKKKFSAKQLAAQKKFAKIMKSGGFKKKAKKAGRKVKKVATKTRTVTKVITKVRRPKTMAKKKSTSRRKSGFKIPFLSNPTIKKAAAGAGIGSILSLGLGLIGQQQLAANPAVKAIGGFAVGDFPGAIAAFLTSGGMSSLGGNGSGFNQMEGSA